MAKDKNDSHNPNKYDPLDPKGNLKNPDPNSKYIDLKEPELVRDDDLRRDFMRRKGYDDLSSIRIHTGIIPHNLSNNLKDGLGESHKPEKDNPFMSYSEARDILFQAAIQSGYEHVGNVSHLYAPDLRIGLEAQGLEVSILTPLQITTTFKGLIKLSFDSLTKRKVDVFARQNPNSKFISTASKGN